MPNPKRYKEKSNFMKDCLHVTLHKEKKKKQHGLAQCLNMWRQKGRRVASRFLEARALDIPNGLKNVIQTVQNKMKRYFHFSMPSDVDWRTYDHLDYPKDKIADDKDGGFITKDFKKIYIDLDAFKNKSYEDFVAHEMGHFLDKHLGGGTYFSHQQGKNTSYEVFAMMVDYVINNGHSGGPTQTALYNAACDKIGIPNKQRVKPGKEV